MNASPDPSPSASPRTQFAKFLLVGGIAAGVNVASRGLFDIVVPYEVAIVLAFCCGLTTGFLLNKQFVFEAAGHGTHEQFARFLFVNLLALVQVWLISVGLANWLFPAVGFDFHPHTIAHVVGVVTPVFTSYVAHKRYTFRRRGGGTDVSGGARS